MDRIVKEKYPPKHNTVSYNSDGVSKIATVVDTENGNEKDRE